MKTLFRILLISFCLLPVKVYCQDFDNYKPLEPTGTVPDKFLAPAHKMYEKDVAKISKKEKGRTKRAMKEFYLDANYEVEELLHSGKVLYNDPLSAYLNKILDELLKSNPDLRKQVEVYVIKSGEVNAFTNFNGVICVTMGMLANIKTEAQLAFVLGHEVTHFEKQHQLDEYVIKKDIDRGRGRFSSASDVQKLLARRAYSKDKETEADEGSLMKYLKTDYSRSGAISHFDVLEYSALPFDTIPFDKKFLEADGLKLPKSYFLDKPTPVKPDDENDTFSTHPGSEERKQHIISMLKNTNFTGSKDFIVGEQEFHRIQKMARYELSNIELEDFEYEASLYNSYLLQKTYGDSRYIKKSVALALYGIAKYQDHHRFDKIVSYYNDYQGAPQQVYYMFEQMHYAETNTLAMDYLWRVSKEYPADEELKAMAADLVMEEEYNYYPFNKEAEVEKAAIIKNAKKKPTRTKDKYSYRQDNPIAENKAPVSETKIERVSVFSQDATDKYINAGDAIHDSLTKLPVEYLRKQPDFEKIWDDGQKIAGAKMKEDEKKASPTYMHNKEIADNKLENGGYALGAKKILFLAPYCRRIDDAGLLVMQSEKAKVALEKYIKDDAKTARLNVQIMDASHLAPGSTDTFNDITRLGAFAYSAEEHDSLNFVDYKDADIVALSKKYGTQYVCLMTVISFKYERQFYPANILALLLYPLAPFYLYAIVRPDYYTLAYTSVVNIETGKVEMSQGKYYHQKDTKDLVKGIVYDVCRQIKRKKQR